MSRPNALTCKAPNWPACNKALKCGGALAIWFDPDVAWAAKPTGKRGRHPVCSDAAVQTCLPMKVLSGMALRQRTGFVESLPCMIGLHRDVPDFSTLSRRQTTLAVNIPHWRSQAPLQLLIDSTGIKVEVGVEGEGTQARWAKTPRLADGPLRVWWKVHLGSGRRSTSGLVTKHWKSGQSRSPAATLGMRPC